MNSLKNLYEKIIDFPNQELGERFHQLVGLDLHKTRMSKIIKLLIDNKGVEKWVQKYYPDNKQINNLLKRPPLIILEGDVGCGKTELATTISHQIAIDQKIDIVFYSLSLRIRGEGKVGQMTALISDAFTAAIEQAKKYKNSSSKARSAVILFIDEADALVQSRVNEHMHHEDRAGVNALIRGIDNIGDGTLPMAVIMCTNRINNVDPAIKRRAAEILKFKRPDKLQREKLLTSIFGDFGFSYSEIKALSEATGNRGNNTYGATYSDIRNRLFNSVFLDAYPDNPLSSVRALDIAKKLPLTPPFVEEEIG